MPTTHNHDRSTKSDLAYDKVRAGIADGTLAPGHRLVVGELAEQLGYSTVPIRQALSRLQAEGLVTYTRHIGSRVADLQDGDYRDAADTVAYLEGWAFAQAAGSLSADDFARCRDINQQMLAAIDSSDRQAFHCLDRDFHRVIIKHTPNRRLGSLIELEAGRLQLPTRQPLSRQRALACVQEHHALLELLGDPSNSHRLQTSARDHVRASHLCSRALEDQLTATLTARAHQS